MQGFVGSLITNYKKMTSAVKSEPQTQPANQLQLVSLSYMECPKSDEHTGELLSLVCLEPECQHSDMLLCCICQEKQHKGHKVKPLKTILRECSNHIQSKKQTEKSTKPIDKEAVLEEISHQEKKCIEAILKCQAEANLAFEQQCRAVKDMFEGLKKQVQSKEVNQTDMEHLLQDIYVNQKVVSQLVSTLRQLIGMIPSEKKVIDNKNIDAQDILQQLTQINNDTIGQIDTTSLAIKKQLDDLNTYFSIKSKTDLFLSNLMFSFSVQHKHANVTIVSPITAKVSVGASGYKFAVMTPSLEQASGKLVKFGFKMKELNASNWLAVGMCHLDTIISKNYTFSFSTLGHGAYMISSNGGSWSTTKAQFNNVVKTFKFAKNDTIYCYFDPQAKTLTFKKAKSSETYKLDFINTTEQLHPCALFYYNNDEVEFLQPDQILE